MLDRPGFERSTRKLAAIVDSDAARRCTAFFDSAFQCSHHMSTVKRAISFQSNALPCELIDDRQDAVRASIGQLVTNEIGRPALIRPAGWGLRYPLSSADLFPFHAAHLQVLLVVETIDTLGVHRPTFSAKQNCQSPISVTHMGCCQLAQSRSERLLQWPTARVAQRGTRHAHDSR